MVVCFFAVSFVFSYHYLRIRRKYKSNPVETELGMPPASPDASAEIQAAAREKIYKHFRFLSQRQCGYQPFSFMSWFFYSSFLMSKLVLIMSSPDMPVYMATTQKKYNHSMLSIPNQDNPIEGLTSNMLLVSVGLTALIYIMMLQGLTYISLLDNSLPDISHPNLPIYPVQNVRERVVQGRMYVNHPQPWQRSCH